MLGKQVADRIRLVENRLLGVIAKELEDIKKELDVSVSGIDVDFIEVNHFGYQGQTNILNNVSCSISIDGVHIETR